MRCSAANKLWRSVIRFANFKEQLQRIHDAHTPGYLVWPSAAGLVDALHYGRGDWWISLCCPSGNCRAEGISRSGRRWWQCDRYWKWSSDWRSWRRWRSRRQRGKRRRRQCSWPRSRNGRRRRRGWPNGSRRRRWSEPVRGHRHPERKTTRWYLALGQRPRRRRRIGLEIILEIIQSSDKDWRFGAGQGDQGLTIIPPVIGIGTPVVAG
jgi:hypothetical protein